MKITPVDPATVHVAAYKTDPENQCPRCLSRGKRWAAPVRELVQRGMGRQLQRRCSCTVCGLVWTEVYKYTMMVEIEEVEE